MPSTPFTIRFPTQKIRDLCRVCPNLGLSGATSCTLEAPPTSAFSNPPTIRQLSQRAIELGLLLKLRWCERGFTPSLSRPRNFSRYCSLCVPFSFPAWHIADFQSAGTYHFWITISQSVPGPWSISLLTKSITGAIGDHSKSRPQCMPAAQFSAHSVPSAFCHKMRRTRGQHEVTEPQNTMATLHPIWLTQNQRPSYRSCLNANSRKFCLMAIIGLGIQYYAEQTWESYCCWLRNGRRRRRKAIPAGTGQHRGFERRCHTWYFCVSNLASLLSYEHQWSAEKWFGQW